MFNARLTDTTVTGSGEPRDSAVEVTRSYTFNDAEIVCKVDARESAGNKGFCSTAGRTACASTSPKPLRCCHSCSFRRPVRRWGGALPPTPTAVTAFDADGKPLGAVGAKPTLASAVLIDRGGFGARIELDKPRAVLLGENSTLLTLPWPTHRTRSTLGLEYKIVLPEGDLAPAAANVPGWSRNRNWPPSG